MTAIAIRDQIRATLVDVIAPLFRDTPLEAQRATLEAMGADAILPEDLRVEPTTLAGMPAERLVPAGPLIEGRVVLHLHGGGFVMGSCTSHRGLAARIGAACRAEAWLPEYRLAPEHPFPAGPDDALAAYEALLAAGADAERVVISGDSAGGGLALGLAARIAHRGLPRPGALVLMSPFLDLTLSGASFRTRAAVDPWLDPGLFSPICEMYLGGVDAADPLASPLFGALAGLPPTLIQVGDHEVLLDDSVRLAARLQAAGVATTLEVAPDMWHVYPLFAPALPEGLAALERVGAFVDRALAAARR